MIVAEESSEDSDHDNHEHVRAVLESMGLDPDGNGYEADSDTSESPQESDPAEGEYSFNRDQYQGPVSLYFDSQGQPITDDD